jgi:hypothetical protein
MSMIMTAHRTTVTDICKQVHAWLLLAEKLSNHALKVPPETTSRDWNSSVCRAWYYENCVLSAQKPTVGSTTSAVEPNRRALYFLTAEMIDAVPSY